MRGVGRRGERGSGWARVVWAGKKESGPWAASGWVCFGDGLGFQAGLKC